MTLAVFKEDKPDQPVESALRTGAEKVVQGKAKMLQNFKVRPEGLQIRQVAGKPAISYVADYSTQTAGKMVEYRTVVRGDSTEARFSANCPLEQFDAYRARFDSMLESLKLK